MKKTDLAYLAGIFDGEGCIVIHDRQWITKTGIKRIGFYPEICVASTNEWIIQQLKFAFGGNVYLRKKGTTRAQPIWAWQTTSKKATSCLKALLPYLRLKRRQAELAIEMENRRRPRGSHKLEPKDNIAWQQAQKILISKLNKGKATSRETGGNNQ